MAPSGLYARLCHAFLVSFMLFLGPFYGATAVLSVTRCRCCCCGHRFYIAIHQVSLLSHAATVAHRLRIDVHDNDNDNNDNA